jgi:[acyl-carrier-protein] S-malonyltransferase
VRFNDPQIPVYNNVDARKVTTAAEARDGLQRQVSRAVRWTELIQHMIGDGARTFVEVGPGNVLAGLIRRIDRSVERLAANDVATIFALRARLASH